MILAMDTSSAMTSVALVDTDRVRVERSHVDARNHAEVLAPLLVEVLAGIARTHIDAIACGVGPGPYTGLRVGIATALALGAAWERPVHGICSLDALAVEALAEHSTATGEGVCVAADARRRELYWARYGADGARLEGPRVTRPDEIDAGLRRGVWIGHGARLHPELFGHVVGGEGYPLASWVGRRVGALLDAGVTPTAVDVPLDAHGQDSGVSSQALGAAALLPPRPLYLRRPDAAVPGGPS